MKHALDTSFTPAPMIPQLRKIDVLTGELLYAVELDTNDASSTAMISDILFSPITSSAERRKPPLIVVGSTNSANNDESLFGTSNTSALTSGTGDFDGYILFLNPEEGTISKDPVTEKWAWRVASTGDNTDDFIEGACLSPDQQFLFVVGSTEGIIEGIDSGGAFVIMYDLSTGEMVWQYQITGDQVQGLMCTADDNAVYLGGVTESDLWESPGKLSSSQSPDAFVAKIIDGTAQWIRPLDTTLEEQGELRREWITGMEVTNQGNILVLLNSINLESGASDVFLVDLDPEMGDNDLYAALNYAGEGIDTFNSLAKRSRTEKEVNIAAIVVPLILGLGVFGMTCWWQYRRKNERIPKSHHDEHMEIEVTRDEDMVNHDGGSELL
jgi:WD40 repeat protein